MYKYCMIQELAGWLKGNKNDHQILLSFMRTKRTRMQNNEHAARQESTSFIAKIIFKFQIMSDKGAWIF